MTESNDEAWEKRHSRFYQIGGITIQVDADLPFTERTLKSKFNCFRVDGPGADNVRIHHHFTIPNWPVEERGNEVYRKPPWAIYRKDNSWIYAGIPPDGKDEPLHQLAIFSEDHEFGHIYNRGAHKFRAGDIASLTMFPTDQILVARLLADRDGCYLHSCGAVIEGKGLLFVGHSETGKTTTARMIAPFSEILCDDRNIVRHHSDGWHVYGSWSHGELPEVSSRSAPLHGIFFLEQATVNRLTLIEERRLITRRLFATVIRPFVTADWWSKTLNIIEAISWEVPCYVMQFDKSGDIVEALRSL